MSAKSPKVSFIVPVYNAKDYIANCVESVLNQDYKNLELILVDDGSSDSTLEICKKYAAKDKRVKVIHQKNAGQTVARQTGFKKSSGQYIWLIDADDWLAPKAVSTAVQAVLENQSDIVTFNVYFNYGQSATKINQSVKSGVYDKETLIKEVYPKMLYSGRFFYFGVFAAMWNKLYKRELIENNLLNVDPSVRIGEDGLTTFASFLDANKVTVLGNKYLYHYRDNNPSITRSYMPEQFGSTRNLIKSLRGINKTKSVYDLSGQIDAYYIYNIWSIFIEEFYYKHNKRFSERYKYLAKIAKDRSVIRAAEQMPKSGLNFSQRWFVRFLINKNTNLAVSLSIGTALKRRFKLTVKKIIKR